MNSAATAGMLFVYLMGMTMRSVCAMCASPC